MSKESGLSNERVNRLTKYGRFWTLVQTIYTRAKSFIFIVLLLIILLVAYFLTPEIERLLGNAHNLFISILGVGVLILLIDGFWFVNYRKRVTLLTKMSQTLRFVARIFNWRERIARCRLVCRVQVLISLASLAAHIWFRIIHSVIGPSQK